jgi:hypothetical protein
MELVVCKGANVSKIISEYDSCGRRVFDDVINVNTISENELFSHAVLKTDPDKYSVVLYGNIVTILEPEQVTDLISDFCRRLTFDVFYLARYGDEYASHEDFREIKTVTTMRVFHAHGIEALIISPSGKKTLENKLTLRDGRGYDYLLNALCPKMTNYSCFPLVFNFDLRKRRSEHELIKGILCRESIKELKPPKLTPKNTSSTNTIWFILVLIFIFCLAMFAITLTDDRTFTFANDVVLNPVLPYDPRGEYTHV